MWEDWAGHEVVKALKEEEEEKEEEYGEFEAEFGGDLKNMNGTFHVARSLDGRTLTCS